MCSSVTGLPGFASENLPLTGRMIIVAGDDTDIQPARRDSSALTMRPHHASESCLEQRLLGPFRNV